MLSMTHSASSTVLYSTEAYETRESYLVAFVLRLLSSQDAVRGVGKRNADLQNEVDFLVQAGSHRKFLFCAPP